MRIGFVLLRVRARKTRSLSRQQKIIKALTYMFRSGNIVCILLVKSALTSYIITNYPYHQHG